MTRMTFQMPMISSREYHWPPVDAIGVLSQIRFTVEGDPEVHIAEVMGVSKPNGPGSLVLTLDLPDVPVIDSIMGDTEGLSPIMGIVPPPEEEPMGPPKRFNEFDVRIEITSESEEHEVTVTHTPTNITVSRTRHSRSRARQDAMEELYRRVRMVEGWSDS